ncbi:MAG: alginate lyase family protein [Caldilineaceae bacterium]
MQHKYFVFVLVILSLVLPGTVLAHGNTPISYKNQANPVLLNGTTVHTLMVEATTAPTATNPVVDEANEPNDPDTPLTQPEAQNLHAYLPIATTGNSDNGALQAAAAPVVPTIGMWLNAQEIAALPMAGTAWTYLKAQADQASGAVTLSNQDSDANVNVLAKALVYARTGIPTYRAAVVTALRTIATGDTEKGARALAVGRELAAYVIAADLIDLHSADPALDTQFRAKLRYLLTAPLTGGPSTLIASNEQRPNNWGMHAGASRIAVAIYLGDKAQLDRAATIFQGWLGDRTKYTGFTYGPLDWQSDPSHPVGVNPPVASKGSHPIDGALPDDMRRGGAFTWPPKPTGYPWEALQGAVVQAELLSRAGYPAWEWQSKAILRSVKFLYSIGWPAVGDDEWQIWLINRAYGTNYATNDKASPGKNMGWTSWTSAR